ncbi:MAG: nitrous oxide-stimulated promoter family protein, partial [Candidatus Tectomicrobia bacterium]|nr:nitrous oxide-stimulated promoter family protein [Candidatus Tectomicrobia bacterium]
MALFRIKIKRGGFLLDTENARMKREKKTIQTMIRLYCRVHHHADKELCPECQELLDYSVIRINRCHFKEEKPTCANCPIHCYKLAMREKIRTVMRYSGPRMTYRHPIL